MSFYVFKIAKRKDGLTILLMFVLYCALFYFKFNNNPNRIYLFIHYFIFVAFFEETVFRGILYYELKSFNKLFAVLFSGSLFGIMHAIIPSILSNDSLLETIMNGLSEVGGGILFGLLCIYLLDNTKNLWFPIIAHALLNVSWVGYIITFAYLMYLYHKKREFITIHNRGL